MVPDKITGMMYSDVRIPMYHQLKETLHSRIENGEYRVGDCIPPERELCVRYGVSKMTVRQAIRGLVNEGLVVCYPGKGTFVTKPTIKQNLHRLTSFTEDMLSRGFSPSSKVIRRDIVRAPDISDVAAKLELGPDEKIIRSQRLRMADSEPVAIETSHIPYYLCPGLVKENIVKYSIKKLLEGKYGLIFHRAVQTMEPGLADEHEARLLNTRKGSPVLHAERICYLKNGKPVDFTFSVYKGGKYRFQVELAR
jgi:GntR family transcriptional regulator